MSLLENSVSNYQDDSNINVAEPPKKKPNKDEMTLSLQKVVRHRNAMPAHLKEEKRRGIESLKVLFEKVMQDKGIFNEINIVKTGSNEFNLEGLSEQDLHSFLVKAEELGKDITYTRSLKIEITD